VAAEASMAKGHHNNNDSAFVRSRSISPPSPSAGKHFPEDFPSISMAKALAKEEALAAHDSLLTRGRSRGSERGEKASVHINFQPLDRKRLFAPPDPALRFPTKPSNARPHTFHSPFVGRVQPPPLPIDQVEPSARMKADAPPPVVSCLSARASRLTTRPGGALGNVTERGADIVHQRRASASDDPNMNMTSDTSAVSEGERLGTSSFAERPLSEATSLNPPTFQERRLTLDTLPMPQPEVGEARRGVVAHEVAEMLLGENKQEEHSNATNQQPPMMVNATPISPSKSMAAAFAGPVLDVVPLVVPERGPREPNRIAGVRAPAPLGNRGFIRLSSLCPVIHSRPAAEFIQQTLDPLLTHVMYYDVWLFPSAEKPHIGFVSLKDEAEASRSLVRTRRKFTFYGVEAATSDYSELIKCAGSYTKEQGVPTPAFYNPSLNRRKSPGRG